MQLHKILKRQLSRLGLSEDKLPADAKTWGDLIKHINQSYVEADQERYLLERSMEISSREMQFLNTRSEEAQKIAQLGYWSLELPSNKSIWSKEVYYLLGIEPSMPAEKLDKIPGLQPQPDRPEIKVLLQQAIQSGQGFETEICCKTQDKSLKHFYVIGHTKTNLAGEVNEVSGILMDITKRKEAEEKLNTLHQQLVSSARRAGMTDVATAVLHNVGNILNSVNVSMGMITENVNLEQINKLLAIEKLILEHKANLPEYLTNDEKGKLIPDYLLALTQKFAGSYKLVLEEVRNLKEKLEHIKQITLMQKTLSGASDVKEKIFLPEVIDAAISICIKELERKGITIIKEFTQTPFIETDKSKVMQILINLIQNAKDSLQAESKKKNKKIAISIIADDNKTYQVIIEDNGTGISVENLTKIFSFGFTTKEHGHGFGLHSSALSAKELGGKLEAYSSGIGSGAKFILTLPISNPSKRKEHGKEHEAKTENYSH